MAFGDDTWTSNLHQDALLSVLSSSLSIWSQHGPMMFFHKTNCSKSAVLVPNTREKVSPWMSIGRPGLLYGYMSLRYSASLGISGSSKAYLRLHGLILCISTPSLLIRLSASS